MQKARLKEIIDNVLAWGLDQDAEFRECLVYAMNLTADEVEELDLNNYVNKGWNYDENIYSIHFYAGYHEWCLTLNETDVYSFGDLTEDMYNENLSFDENVDIVIEVLVDSMIEYAKYDESNLTRIQRNLILKLTDENLKALKSQMKKELTLHYKFD